MRLRRWLLCLCAALLLSSPLLLAAPDDKLKEEVVITWKKTQLDKVFRSEGVAVADVNKDGKLDILNGEAWYEAPNWKMHEIRKLGNYGNGQGSYSESFACWAEDINGDGWADLIVIDFPGKPCYW